MKIPARICHFLTFYSLFFSAKIEKQRNNSSQILLIKIHAFVISSHFFSILILFPFQFVRKVLDYAIDKK